MITTHINNRLINNKFSLLNTGTETGMPETPDPEIVISSGLVAALVVIEITSSKLPGVIGLKVISNSQVSSGARVVGMGRLKQPPPIKVKGADGAVVAMNSKPVLPVLVAVIMIDSVVLMLTEPKSMVVLLKVISGS